MTTPLLTADQAEALARTHGTPYYLYDVDVVLARLARVRQAFPGAKVLYAAKANPNLELLRALAGAVDGLDVSSAGELDLALAAGYPPTSLSFAGPGKTPAELARAVEVGALVSAESVQELKQLAALGPARVRVRLNPKERVHAYRVPMMGLPSPFGVDEEDLPSVAQALHALAGRLDFEGIHVHPGAQCTSAAAVGRAWAASLALMRRLRDEHGVPSRSINLGGGFGALPDGSAELDVGAAGQRLSALLAEHSPQPQVVLELGRFLVGPAGVYVARVVSTKRSRGVSFAILDGGMNHYLGAGARFVGAGAGQARFTNLSHPDGAVGRWTVVGPLCTPLDTWGEHMELREPRPGDLLAMEGSGAYGFTFSPLLFLGHPSPVEMLRRNGEVRGALCSPSVPNLTQCGYHKPREDYLDCAGCSAS